MSNNITKKLDGSMIEQPKAARLNLQMWRRRSPQEVRCLNCSRLLLRSVLAPGTYLDIRCPRCSKHLVVDVAVTDESAPILIDMLESMNGTTPKTVKSAMRRIVEKDI